MIQEVDYLLLQWYEVNRRIIKRKTVGGLEIALDRPPKTPIHDGEVLCEQDGVSVKARIEPCLCIVLATDDIETVGSFCFDVANRHLPIFAVDDKFLVSYDGHLFQALSMKYGTSVWVEEQVLRVEQAVKPFGNYY